MSRAGYDVTSLKADARVITLRARRGKVRARASAQRHPEVYKERYLAKLSRNFALPHGAPEHILWWHRKIDAGGFYPLGTQSFLSRFSDVLKRFMLRVRLARWGIAASRTEARFELLAKGLTKRYTAATDSPLEIQWEGELMMLYK